ncbi:hypothetical protein KC363_g8 [Hortaea werneckii]|nr:hypothetical protein KC363_g8 [Hortaea werneckii]
MNCRMLGREVLAGGLPDPRRVRKFSGGGCAPVFVITLVRINTRLGWWLLSWLQDKVSSRHVRMAARRYPKPRVRQRW